MTGRRDRPTEMIGDRQRPPGPAGYPKARTVPARPGAAVANGAERTTASGPVRAVSPATGQEARPSASGALRVVPTTGGVGTPRPNGRPATGRTAPPATGPRDAAPPSTGGRAAASGPLRAVPSAAPGSWEAFRSTPAGAPNRARPVPSAAPATAAPAREQPAALREPVGRPYLPAAVPRRAHRAGQGPGRASAPRGRRPVPDAGPDTGAYDPFALDDEGSEDGPETVVGRPRAPRRAPFPRLIEGPETDLDLGGGRRSDGPVTRVDPAGRARRDEDAATRFDVPELRRGVGTTDFGTSGRPGRSDGPATDFDVTALDVPVRPGPRGPAGLAGGPPPAPVRPTFGTGPRRTGSAPVPAAAPAPRVRPFARKVVDEPTELTDRSLDELDGFDDIHDADGFGAWRHDRGRRPDGRRRAAPARATGPRPPPGQRGDEDDDPAPTTSPTTSPATRRSLRRPRPGRPRPGRPRPGRPRPDDRDELVEREQDVDDLDDADDDLDDLDDEERTVRRPRPGPGSSRSGSRARSRARCCGCCSATSGAGCPSSRSPPPCSSPSARPLVRQLCTRRPAHHPVRRPGRAAAHGVPGGAGTTGDDELRPSRSPPPRCIPETVPAGFALAARAGLRRRRADGVGRAGEPGRRRGRPARRRVRRPGAGGARALPRGHPAGVDRRTRSSACAARSRAAERARRARRSCMHPPFRWQRRYAAVFADEVRRAEEHAGHRAGRGEHVPGGPRRRARRALRARASTPPTSATGATRWTCPTPRPPGMDALGAAGADGRRARARPPRRRQRRPARRAPRARPRDPALRAGLRAARGVGVRRRGGPGGQHPARPHAGTTGTTLLAEALLFARLHLRAPAQPTPILG